MELKVIEKGITVCRPTTEDGFELNGRLWTKSSPECSLWKEAVGFCDDRKTLLHTLDETVEFRSATNGAHASNLPQWTRTLICLTPDGRAGQRAYIFEPEEDELRLVLARPEIAKNQAYILLDTNEDLGKRVKRFGDKTGRTFNVSQEALKLGIRPVTSGQSEYGTSVYTKALMPDHAEHNAQYILANQDKVHQDYRGFGYVWFARPDLEKGHMLIRPVGLGSSGNYDDFGGVFADVGFNAGKGWARGVASAPKKSP
ncbi:hypothetical protein HY641_03660 [Candidatus Woesearchaeota archaeon]|nr:hypothetical protein [Candidatus Woesearchaeota archaeon]